MGTAAVPLPTFPFQAIKHPPYAHPTDKAICHCWMTQLFTGSLTRRNRNGRHLCAGHNGYWHVSENMHHLIAVFNKSPLLFKPGTPFVRLRRVKGDPSRKSKVMPQGEANCSTKRLAAKDDRRLTRQTIALLTTTSPILLYKDTICDPIFVKIY